MGYLLTHLVSESAGRDTGAPALQDEVLALDYAALD